MLLLAFCAVLFLTGGFWMLRHPTRHHDEEQETPPQVVGQKDWTKWDKPLFAIVFSGQMNGYYDPCGCSDPQYGGLVRRYNLVEAIKAKGWDVIGLDLGDVAQTQGIQKQNLLRYELSMKALATMNYRAVGIGTNEVLSPLGDALAQAWEQNRPLPRPLSISLEDVAPGKHLNQLNAQPYEIVHINNNLPKIGVLSMMGPDMRALLEGKEKFSNTAKEFENALTAFGQAGVDFGVILHHEHPNVPQNLQGGARMAQIQKTREEVAKRCAQFAEFERQKKNPRIPPIHLMMMLTDWDTPPAGMAALDPSVPTQVIEVGHKGIYVGLVGVYRDPKKGYRFEYQLIKLGPEWATPNEKKANHPVIKLIENYNMALKREKMLDHFPRTLHFNQLPAVGQKGLRATYVGSDRCADCHDKAYDVWKETYHAKATHTLEDLKFPAGRHYDPECMKCHTTGLQHPGGYNNPILALANYPNVPQPTPKQIDIHNNGPILPGGQRGVGLRGVGCESCHGPGSEHVKNPNNKDLYPVINPFRIDDTERVMVDNFLKNPKNKELEAALRKQFDRKRAMGFACQNCHDQENDVNWGKPGKTLFDKWLVGNDKNPRLVHHDPARLPKAGAQPKLNPPQDKGKDAPPIIIEIIEKK